MLRHHRQTREGTHTHVHHYGFFGHWLHDPRFWALLALLAVIALLIAAVLLSPGSPGAPRTFPTYPYYF